MLVWLAGCSSDQPLIVSLHPWLGYETLFLAHEFGWLPSNVKLHETKNATESQLALLSGQVDAACLTLDEALRIQATGLPIIIVLVFDISAGADNVVARSNINTLADLAGKKIGFENTGVGALIFSKLLEAANLPNTALKIVNLSPDNQLVAWRNAEVDAVITYEPVTQHLTSEGGHILFDSRQMPDTIFDVLAVRADRISGRDHALKALIESHFRGLSHLQVNRYDALYRIAPHQGLSYAAINKILAGINLPSLVANQSYLANNGVLVSAAKSIANILLQHQIIRKEPNLTKFINPVWLPSGQN